MLIDFTRYCFFSSRQFNFSQTLAVHTFSWSSVDRALGNTHLPSNYLGFHSNCWSFRRQHKSRRSNRFHHLLLHNVHRQLFGEYRDFRSETSKPLYLLIVSKQIPLVGLLRSPKSFLIVVAALFVLTRLSFIVTHIGFPYSDDPANPTPQRHYITVYHHLRISFLSSRIS